MSDLPADRKELHGLVNEETGDEKWVLLMYRDNVMTHEDAFNTKAEAEYAMRNDPLFDHGAIH